MANTNRLRPLSALFCCLLIASGGYAQQTQPGVLPEGPPTTTAPSQGQTLQEVFVVASGALARAEQRGPEEAAEKQSDLQTARDGFAAVLARDSSHPTALLGMADVLRLGGPRSGLEAGEYYRQFLRIRPSRLVGLDGRAYFGLGRVYLEAGYYRLAKEPLEKAYTLAVRDPERVSALAAACAGLKEWDRAIQLAQQAVELEPDNPERYAQLASYYMGTRNYPEAVKAAQSGVDLLRTKLRERPGDPFLLQFAQGMQSQKLQALTAQVQEEGENAQLWLRISRASQELIPIAQAMMYYEALRYAEQAALYAPDEPAIGVNQARLLYLLGRTSDAEKVLQALQSAGKTAQTLDLVQRQLQVVGSDPALEQIARFLKQNADQPATP